MDCKGIAAGLEEDGFVLRPDFLSGPELLGVQGHFERTLASGGFKRAGTGKGAALEVRDEIRRDEIFWCERGSAEPAQRPLWSRLDELKTALNRELFLGIREFEGHYASYPAGGFYGRHRDCFRQDDARKVSLILYLNRAWAPSHGGHLRLFRTLGRVASPLDIAPVGGTLVLFLSAEMEHEVLPSQAPRASFTGWFKA